MADASRQQFVSRLLFAFGLLALVGLALSVLSLGSPQLRPLTPWVRGPAFVGRVTDMASGQPVGQARVAAAGRTTESQGDGWYRLEVPPGRFSLRFEAPGYSGGSLLAVGIESGEERIDFALPPLVQPAWSIPMPAETQSTQAHRPGPEQMPDLSRLEPVRELPSTIRVLMADGSIVAMDIEEYVKGVVPAEMGFIYRRPFEALKAQAVAARTYAATGCLADSAGDPARCEPGVDANVDTTTRTQVWRPIHYDVTDAAVEATRGLAVSHDGGLIRALYFARTRDRTLSSEDSTCCGGRQVAYLRSASSPDAFADRRGHGAGMSQEGAAVFADWGATAAEILEHYYADSRVILAPPPTATAPATTTAAVLTAAVPTATSELQGRGTIAVPEKPSPKASAARATAVAPQPSLSARHPVIRGGRLELTANDLSIVRGQAEVRPDGVRMVGPGMLSLEGPPLTADFAFTAVGVQWSAELPPDAELLMVVRTSHDGRQWSPWQELLVDEDDRMTGSATPSWSRLLVGAGRMVQVAARLRSTGIAAASLPSLSGITLHYIDGSAGPTAPVRAEALGRLIRRAEWGADERLRFDSRGEEIWPPEYVVPLAQLVHHTVTGNEAVDPASVVRSIYYYHAVSRGWGDIGYNFLVDDRGNVYEGRYGGELNGQIAAGGHAREFNAVTIGVAVLGTFTSASPSSAMEAGLVDLLAAKALTYGLAPFDPVVLLGRPFPYRLLGHRDVGQTECPGDGVYRRLPAIRQAVAARVASGATRMPQATATRTSGSTPQQTASRVPTAVGPTPGPTSSRAPTATSLPPPTTLPPDCEQLVGGGSFESDDPRWVLQNAFYTQYEAYRGRRSLFIGLRPTDPDLGITYSTAQQSLLLPEAIASAKLSFAIRAVGDPDDRRATRLLDQDGAVIGLGDLALRVGPWQELSLDVTAELKGHAGREVRLYVANVNNGDGERSFLRLDEVSLVACRSSSISTALSPTPIEGTASPAVATPAATDVGQPIEPPPATATPGGPGPTEPTPRFPGPEPAATSTVECLDALRDGAFENPALDDWHPSGDVLPRWMPGGRGMPAGAIALAFDEAKGNRLSYAALAQPVLLPLGVLTATLSLWWRGEQAGSEDRLVVELRERQAGWRYVVAQTTVSANQSWQQLEVKLDPRTLGREREIYVAVLRRPPLAAGGAPRLYLDDLTLMVCYRPTQPLYLPNAERAVP